eukprot:1383428-Amorphochlora_amoeboformis.AAC.1
MWTREGRGGGESEGNPTPRVGEGPREMSTSRVERSRYELRERGNWSIHRSKMGGVRACGGYSRRERKKEEERRKKREKKRGLDSMSEWWEGRE